jgi:hypothetical protein
MRNLRATVGRLRGHELMDVMPRDQPAHRVSNEIDVPRVAVFLRVLDIFSELLRVSSIVLVG